MTNLRNIPGIDELLIMSPIQDLLKQYNREFIVKLLRQAVAEIRQELRLNGGSSSKEELSAEILEWLEQAILIATGGSLQKVINGTGVVLHTNLGRAPLGQRALDCLRDMAQNYNNLEIDLASGERGSRYQHVEELLLALTGAEAGLVVNNNAAAVLLGLSSLARDKEVIVSRGQLIEIGGSFRIPEVMKQSGARLVEVGTTNKTYITDYSQAINENTGLIFSAHTSNYKIMGFSAEVKLSELVALGKERNIPVMHDLGSGILSDLGEWGLKDEPTVQACVGSGADVICFSGDKLLGGPQAGIILGKPKYIAMMKKNQLTRALRVDKLNIAALEGTLREYFSGDPLLNIPVLNMLTMPPERLWQKAQDLMTALTEKLERCDMIQSIKVIETEDMVGAGAYPTYKIPGYGVQIAVNHKQLENLAGQLRQIRPAVLIRKQEDKMLISVRTLLEGDAETLVELIGKILLSDSGHKKDSGDK
ncbi:MAG: L-seryl-tRNA(Sec) selenium transferase [Syntrophomonadaceae bacterium]|nr:L-seryl-tRNA(Sec) selenium transferase [Syntrophomonadaceae bacterium]